MVQQHYQSTTAYLARIYGVSAGDNKLLVHEPCARMMRKCVPPSQTGRARRNSFEVDVSTALFLIIMIALS